MLSVLESEGLSLGSYSGARCKLFYSPRRVAVMTSESESQNTLGVTSTASAPSDDIVAAALEEALQNARLLRVSSSIFLKEAKELLDSGRVRFQSSACYPTCQSAALHVVWVKRASAGIEMLFIISLTYLAEKGNISINKKLM